MEKVKKVVALCLALLLTAAITAVSASAKSLDPVSVASDLAKGERFTFTHPKEAVQIGLSIAYSEPVDDALVNSDDARAFLRIGNIPVTGGVIVKLMITTLNPANSERNRVLSSKIENPASFSSSPKTDDTFNSQFTLLSAQKFNHNDVDINPLFAYKTKNNELVVWGELQNYSGKNVEVYGIPEIRLLTDDKVLAGGAAPEFETPMKFSYRQKQVNTGVYNGLPTQCFIKLTFEPGTYDDTVDITSLDNLDCQYSLNYGYLE